jgi:hypothetical protein
MDGSSRSNELGSHGHEEAVENIDGLLAGDLYLATVESTSELHLLALRPGGIESVSINAEDLALYRGIDKE